MRAQQTTSGKRSCPTDVKEPIDRKLICEIPNNEEVTTCHRMHIHLRHISSTTDTKALNMLLDALPREFDVTRPRLRSTLLSYTIAELHTRPIVARHLPHLMSFLLMDQSPNEASSLLDSILEERTLADLSVFNWYQLFLNGARVPPAELILPSGLHIPAWPRNIITYDPGLRAAVLTMWQTWSKFIHEALAVQVSKDCSLVILAYMGH